MNNHFNYQKQILFNIKNKFYVKVQSVNCQDTLQFFYFSSRSDMKGPKLDQKFGRGFNSVTIVTNFNVFLYSACRFIEAGALPVRFISFNNKCIDNMKKLATENEL